MVPFAIHLYKEMIMSKFSRTIDIEKGSIEFIVSEQKVYMSISIRNGIGRDNYSFIFNPEESEELGKLAIAASKEAKK